jgi:hypothetical protein
LYPETKEVVDMFYRLRKNWRYGSNGPLGLDMSLAIEYCGVYNVQDQAEMIDGLDIMETTWLACFYGDN